MHISFLLKKRPIFYLQAVNQKKNPYFNMIEIKNNKVQIVKKLKKNIYRRQDAPKTYDCNASIYIWKRKSLINFKSFYTNKTVFYEMPESRSIDIDSELDFKLVEFLLKEKNGNKVRE